MASNWSAVVHSALDATPNLIYRYRVVREPIVQQTYNNLYIKHTPPNGLSTNRFPHHTTPGIHNYIYWGDDWNIPETVIYPLFPDDLDIVSYINPPHIRSMGHKPHRNIYIRGVDGIPKLEHIFDETFHLQNNNINRMYWSNDLINNLWTSSVLDRWRPYRSKELDRLVVLLYYGGITIQTGYYNFPSELFYDGIIVSNYNIIGATRFDPLVFDYLQYQTRQTDPNRIDPDLDFINQLSIWERKRITII
jgi:hypothetical protein